MTEADPHGFSAPLRQALIHPLKLGGAPRSWAILNGALSAAIVFSGAPIAGLLAACLGHALGVWLCRKDPLAPTLIARAMRLPARFER
jgi:type IV secretion system protein VirB3